MVIWIINILKINYGSFKNCSLKGSLRKQKWYFCDIAAKKKKNFLETLLTIEMVSKELEVSLENPNWFFYVITANSPFGTFIFKSSLYFYCKPTLSWSTGSPLSRFNPAVVMVASFSQHAVWAMARKRGK